MPLAQLDFNRLEIPSSGGLININQQISPAGVVSSILPFIFSISGIVLILVIAYSGIQIMLSRGDPKKTEAIKTRLTSAAIGILLIFAAYWISEILQKLIGFSFVK